MKRSEFITQYVQRERERELQPAVRCFLCVYIHTYILTCSIEPYIGYVYIYIHAYTYIHIVCLCLFVCVCVLVSLWACSFLEYTDEVLKFLSRLRM